MRQRAVLWVLALGLGACSLLAPLTARQTASSNAAADRATKAAPKEPKATQGPGGPATAARVIDINSASMDELRSIPGIGDAYASKIVAGRPYKNKAQLKSRKILPAAVYDKVAPYMTAKHQK